MANNKQRYINTRFWNDNFVSELNPIDKLLFIYFLTNEHTNISGIYELPVKIMSVETGIEMSMIKKMLPRLNGKVRYLDGKIVIRNFVKHQETKSPLVKKGITNCLKDLDKKWLETIISKGYYLLDQEYIDTLCIPYVYSLNYSNSNSNSNLDSNSIPAIAKEDDITTPDEYSKEFTSFWEVYPNKKGKGYALKAWSKIKGVNKLTEKIIASVEEHKLKDPQWKKDGGQYIPHPSTFLNGRGWEDEIEVETLKEINVKQY